MDARPGRRRTRPAVHADRTAARPCRADDRRPRDEVGGTALAVGQADQVRRRLEDCVTALAAMVEGGWFTGHEDMVGMEVELDLIDPLGRPRPVNDAVLERL